MISALPKLGWGRLSNGELIQNAESQGFDIFGTSDQNLAYQQNLRRRQIALLVLSTNYWPTLERHHRMVASALFVMRPGQYQELAIPAM